MCRIKAAILKQLTYIIEDVKKGNFNDIGYRLSIPQSVTWQLLSERNSYYL